NRRQFGQDVTAGIVVGIVALPLAIAFAIASGVTPDRGLYTAIVAGFLISALGGSRVQIGGPTGAFVVIVYAVVQQHGVNGLFVATIMAGFILIALGLTGLGSAIKFVPHSVIIGFTSGIAVIITKGQLKDLVGDSDGVVNWNAVAISALSLAVILGWPRLSRRLPGPFFALVLATSVVQLLNLPVETVGSRFGHIPSGIPVPSIPKMDLATISALIPSATAIALLAGIESLLSAVVADGMIGGKHRSNMELVAQGIANVVS